MASNAPQPAAGAGATPCQSQGPEILRPGGRITVPLGAAVEFLMLSCFAPGNLIVRLGEATETAPPAAVLVNQLVPPPNPVRLMLPPLPRGLHLLHWSFVPVDSTWQTVVEVAVDGLVKFRHFKSEQSAVPFSTGVLFLEVV